MQIQPPSLPAQDPVAAALILARKISATVLTSISIHSELAFPGAKGESPDSEQPGNTPDDQASDHMTQSTLSVYLGDLYRELGGFTRIVESAEEGALVEFVKRFSATAARIAPILHAACERFTAVRPDMVSALAVRGQTVTVLLARLQGVTEVFGPKIILASS